MQLVMRLAPSRVCNWISTQSLSCCSCTPPVAHTRPLVQAMLCIRLAYTGIFIWYALSLDGGAAHTPSSSAVSAAQLDPSRLPTNTSCLGPSATQHGLMAVVARVTGEYLLVQARAVKRMGLVRWLSRPWNVFDAAQLVLTGAILGLHWTCSAQMEVVRGLSQVLVLVLIWRLLYYAGSIAEPLGTTFGYVGTRCD